MSVKKRVENIAIDTATKVANQVAQFRTQQIQNSLSTVGEVDTVTGTQIRVKFPDGSFRVLTNIGSRILGHGDAVLGDGRNFVF